MTIRSENKTNNQTVNSYFTKCKIGLLIILSLSLTACVSSAVSTAAKVTTTAVKVPIKAGVGATKMVIPDSQDSEEE